MFFDSDANIGLKRLPANSIACHSVPFHIFCRSAPTYTVAPRQRVAVATLDVVLRPTDPSQPPVPPSRGCFAPYSRGPSGTFQICSRLLRLFVVDLYNLSDYQLFIRNSHEVGQWIRKYQTVQTIISLMFSNNSLYAHIVMFLHEYRTYSEKTSVSFRKSMTLMIDMPSSFT